MGRQSPKSKKSTPNTPVWSTGNIVYLVLALILCVVIWLLKDMEDVRLIGYHTLPVRILVPGFALLTAAYNYFARGRKTPLVTVALLFAALAETINALNLSFGLLFFVVTHICLTIYHWKTVGVSRRTELRAGLIFAALYLAIVTFIILGMSRYSLVALDVAVVIIYMVVLSLMAWRSVCTWGTRQSGRIVLGSLLFYVCDVLILTELTAPNFADPPFPLLFLSWAAYLPALFLLSTIGKNIFGKSKF
jgi:hypothetical protein